MPSAIQLDTEERDDLGARIHDEIQQAEADRATLIASVKDGRRLFLALDERLEKDKPWPNSCSLVPPTLKQYLNGLLAHHVPTLLNPEPMFHLEGDGQLDKAMQSEAEQYFDRQLRKQIDFKRAMMSIFHAALTDKVGVGVIAWREEFKGQQVWDVTVEQDMDEATGLPVIDPETGLEMQPTEKRRAKRVLTRTYDGPVVVRMPIERIGTYPAANSDLQKSPGLYIKWYLTRYDLEQMRETGVFDAVALDQLLDTSPDGDPMMPSDTDRAIKSQDNVYRKGPAQGWWVTECYWLRNTRKAEPPEDWRIFLHENTAQILAAAPTPWFTGKRPVFACRPFADPDGIYGDSLADLAGDVQKAEAAILQLTIDMSAMAVDPVRYLPNTAKKQDTQQIKKRPPGTDVYVTGEFIKDIKFSGGATSAFASALLPIWERVTKIGQLGAGMDDSGLGIQPPKDTTATATQDLIEGRLKIIGLQEEGFVEGMTEAAEIIWGMDYQMQGAESLQKLYLDANPEARFMLQQVMEGKYSFVVSGASGGGNRTIRAKRAMERYLLLSQNPIVASNPEKMYALLYDLLKETGDRDPEIYLGRKEEYVMQSQMMMQAQMQAQAEQQAMEQQDKDREFVGKYASKGAAK